MKTMPETEEFIVWTKMEAEAGQALANIIARKEAERIAGGGMFWWGVGTAPKCESICEVVPNPSGRVPVFFSPMISIPKSRDSKPGEVWLWTEWEGPDGKPELLPPHVLVTSRGDLNKTRHYALVCRSTEPINLDGQDAFDPFACRTPAGKRPDPRQRTALLRWNPSDNHSAGAYRVAFSATLIDPMVPRLVGYRPLTQTERDALCTWPDGTDWFEFVKQFRVDHQRG
jgi:hypothetical protein